MDRKVVILVIVGLFLCICIGVAVALLLGGGALLSTTGLTSGFDAVITVDAPVQVRQGDTFDIVIAIENPTSSSMELDSIDIDDVYLEGIFIDRSDPNFSDTFSLGFLEQQTFSYYRAIPANSTLTVTMRASAMRAGDFGGNIDVCINGGGNCQGYVVRTVIE